MNSGDGGRKTIGEVAMQAYRQTVREPEPNAQSHAIPERMSHAERVELIITEMRTLPGWEKERGFCVMSDKTVAAVAEIVVQRAEVWEHVEMEQEDIYKINNDINEHIARYLKAERDNDPMPRATAERLEAEHEARRVEQDSYYLVDVLTADDTITLDEREKCIAETIEKLHKQLSQQASDINRRIDQQLQPKTPAEAKHSHAVELRKSLLRKEWAESILTKKDIDTHRAFRSFYFFTLLQTQSEELFQYARDAYEKGALVTAKKGVVLLDPETGEPLRKEPGHRCFITIHVPAECDTNFAKTWNWRDRVTCTNLPDFRALGDTMDIDEIRARQTCLNHLLEYTETYDPATAFVMQVCVTCMPTRKPPADGLSQDPHHQWLTTEYAYQMARDSCMNPIPLTPDMEWVTQPMDMLHPIAECCECKAYMLEKEKPVQISKANSLRCNPCTIYALRAIAAGECKPRHRCLNIHVVFCSVECAAEHTIRLHPDQMHRKFVKHAAEMQAKRVRTAKLKAERQRDHVRMVASIMDKEEDKAEYLQQQMHLIDLVEKYASATKAERKEADKQRVLAYMREQVAAAQFRRATEASAAAAASSSSAGPSVAEEAAEQLAEMSIQ